MKRFILKIFLLIILPALLFANYSSNELLGYEPIYKAIDSFFPKDTKLDKVIVDENLRLLIYIEVPKSFLEIEFNERILDDLTSFLINSLYNEGRFLGFSIFVKRLEEKESDYKLIDNFLPKLPQVPKKPYELEKNYSYVQGQPPSYGQEQPKGALSGKTIFINGGHGWYYNSSYGWITQRGNTNGIVEDFINAEAVNQYFIQYLWNSGASVYTCRERDMNVNEIIIDNGGPGYETTGSWTTSTSAPKFYGTNYQVTPVSTTQSATASFTPEFPQSGFYSVYVWYASGENRSKDAKYTINHSGGSTLFYQNQKQDGYSWKYIGTYYFEKGYSKEKGSVILSNEGSDPSSYVVADAVRFGGGMGTIIDGGTTSGKPRWEESGRYYAQYAGCDTCGTSTVSAMPRYAKWENEGWEDSVYISWHTNAPNPGTGTSSFVYSSSGWDGPFTGVPGSLELQNFVHSEIINDIRAGYDPSWPDRGKHTANFGEVNPNNNDEMPAVLVELAFHDTPSDAEKLKDPKFRQISARAFYQGIVKYFANRDKIKPKLLPEPPTHFVVQQSGLKNVTLSWNPPPYDSGDGLYGDMATGYKVYVSLNGKGFDNGFYTIKTSMTFNITPGIIYYFKVTALNDGGESFPTETLAVKTSLQNSLKVLVVNGFDRIDKMALIPKDDGGSLGVNLRMYLPYMNSFDYVIQHGKSLDYTDVSFDSCSNEAVLDGKISLLDYDIVDWILGEESTYDETLSSIEQEKLKEYLDNGGSLFISGAEIAWDLDYLGTSQDKTFFHEYLYAGYVNDDGNSYIAEGVPKGIFEGIPKIPFDDGTHEIYAVDYPDSISPLNGAFANLVYEGTSYNAGIQIDNGKFKIVYLGFPFEAIYSEEIRNNMMDRIIKFLLPVRCTDKDKDGYSIDGGLCGEVDCDDENENIYPGAKEICDGVDNDCDGREDEGCKICGGNENVTYSGLGIILTIFISYFFRRSLFVKKELL